MVEYCCEFCEYKTHKTTNLIAHLTRINPCNPLNDKKYVYVKMLNIYVCKGCNHELDICNSMIQHVNTYCKKYKEKREKETKEKQEIEYNNKKQEIDDIKKDLEQKEQELVKLENNKSSINNGTINNGTINNGTINNNDNSINNNLTNNININNHIMIVDFGKEDSSKLSKKDEKYIMEKCWGAILACVEKMHFNEDIPEQQNIYISNLRTNKGYIYENGKFIITNIKTLLIDLINNRADDVRDMLERIDTFNFSDNKKKNVILRIGELLHNIENGDEKTLNIIKEEVINLLYNKKNIPIENEKLINEKKENKTKKEEDKQIEEKKIAEYIKQNPQLVQQILQSTQQPITQIKPKRKYTKKNKQ